MKPTMALIELQTYCISKGESIISDNGEYKLTPEVLKILGKIWNNITLDEQKYLNKLIFKE